jgi:hypothetical protein
MNADETLKCLDGEHITRTQAQLATEREADLLAVELRKTILTAIPSQFEAIWQSIPTPPQGEGPASAEDFYATLKSSMAVAMILGLADGLKITLKKLAEHMEGL